jgi:hypothetical protein
LASALTVAAAAPLRVIVAPAVLLLGLSVPEMLQVWGAGAVVVPTMALVLPHPAHKVRINEPNRSVTITSENLLTAPHLSSYECLASRPADQSRCCLS